MPSHSVVGAFNQVTVPLFELDETGAVKPNPLFHRPWDKLHSRCIEYPFAASQVGSAQSILDVGTVKSDPAWIAWLESLPIDVHATDYDKPTKPFCNVIFYQADVRELPIPDNRFDKIMAVSVVEHIGLRDPQVVSDVLPPYSAGGDVEAVRELVRVLKTGGSLIMTLPFGLHDGLILEGSTRCYTIDSIRKFEAIAEPVFLHYYEYQYSHYMNNYPEYIPNKSLVRRLRERFLKKSREIVGPQKASHLPEQQGVVTWRRIPMENTGATHYKHTDGIICGVWRKR